MIRFLILCTIFVLLYFGFTTIAEFDSNIYFTIFDYQAQTTIFTFGVVFISCQLVLMIFLKMIFLIFDLPTIIKNKWQQMKLRRVNQKLLRIISELLMGNRKKSLDITNRLIPELDEDNKEVTNLILAEVEEGVDKKIQYLRSLVDKKNYSIYAAKKLAGIFFNNAHYKEAEEYAIKAFNEDDTDTELMLILIRIYAKLGLWQKLIFIVSKLQRADTKLLESSSKEIAYYYYLASKVALEAGNDKEAIKFLESALELAPDYLEALNLYTELNVNINKSDSILKVLKLAFAAKPCFEIAEMYAKCSRSSSNAVYGTLAGIVKPNEHTALFLAIAAYLGLSDKITEIKESPKLISYVAKE